jgi:hypothetical protein
MLICQLKQSQEGGERDQSRHDEHKITCVLKEAIAAELEVSCDYPKAHQANQH